MFSVPSGEEVRSLRKRANLTQKELAEKTGLSQGLIAKIENGTVDPKASTLRKILNVLENEIKEKREHDVRACDIMTKKVISINHDETVRRALELMTAYGISQLPVIKEEKVIGAVDEESLLQALPKFLGNPKKFYDTKVDKVISAYFPVIVEETSLGDVINLLSRGHRGILVSNKEGKIVGIITKIDVLNALSTR